MDTITGTKVDRMQVIGTDFVDHGIHELRDESGKVSGNFHFVEAVSGSNYAKLLDRQGYKKVSKAKGLSHYFKRV